MNGRLEHARGWLRKAESDALAARRLVGAGGPFDAACFHAQQTAEKALKALLALCDRPIPRTHNLEELARLCLEAAPNPTLAAMDLAELTPYAVETRYDFDFWPDEATARSALELSERMRALAETRLTSEEAAA